MINVGINIFRKNEKRINEEKATDTIIQNVNEIDPETKKLLVQIYLEEFKSAKSDIIKLVEFQDKAIRYTLLMIGIFIGVYNITKYEIVFLIAPILLYILGFYVLHNLDKIVVLVGFINNSLKPNLEKILNTDFNLFGWDKYFTEHGGVLDGSLKSKIIHISSLLALVSAPFSFVIFYIMQKIDISIWSSEEMILTGIDLVLGFIIIYRVYKSWHIEYKSLSNHYKI